MLLEEFIGGREYHCNGQVDAEGNVTIIDIGRTHYAETDRREIVCLRTDQTPFAAPEFAAIADYTQATVLDPNYLSAYKKLATTQRKAGNDAAAQAAAAMVAKLSAPKTKK